MRLSIVRLVFILFLTAITFRLFYWQVIMADQLQVQAEGQYFTNIKVGAVRGKIFYSDNFLLASSTPVFSVIASPKALSAEQKTKIAHSLAQLLSKDEEQKQLEADFKEKLSQDLYWIVLKKNINMDLKKQIEDLNLPTIGFDAATNRFYPEGSSAAHLLGFIGSDAKGQNTGYFGIEGYYDGELKGVSGFLRHEKDALGLPILIGKFLTSEPKNGKDLTLNIDRSVQFIVEETLKKGIEKYGARAGSAVVMDPKTGAILALAAYPNYDPSKYFDFPKDYYKDPVVADQYEPGSTFKILVMASAINEDLVKPETKCDICSGPITMGGFTIRTWNNQYLLNLTMTEVIIHSDNTGMVFVSKKLGLDKFYSYLENFGFGKSTNIDLQDESFPDLRPKSDWREIDLATASFGQGIAVTPIQMIRAVATIANGGNLVEPHVVKVIQDGNSTYEIKPKVIRQVIKPQTAKVITDMMVSAVREGEAKFYRLKGFKIAGKTGTAQIPVAGHYDPDQTIASFVGFAPADDPKFVMLVRYDQPTASIYGAETAAPTFFEIAKQLFAYYNIVPSE